MADRGWALVTGAARRIGRTLALTAARAGYDVVVHHRRSAEDAAETVVVEIPEASLERASTVWGAPPSA